METKLQNKCVLITGASGGIGQACANVFAREGARLALHYYRRFDPLRRLADQLTVEHTTLQADLRREDDVVRMFDEAANSFGQIDILVANAGIWIADEVPIHRMTLDQWNETLATDLTSVFLCCREFMRRLSTKPREDASIVMVGSTAAIFGEANHSDYAAAKAGMVYGLTRSLKNEIVHLAPKGRVNAVCPGWVETPMAEDGLKNEAAIARVFSTSSLRKIASADDIANVIAFLSSEALAGHITGSIIPIAGGMEGRLLHDPNTS